MQGEKQQSAVRLSMADPLPTRFPMLLVAQQDFPSDTAEEEVKLRLQYQTILPNPRHLTFAMQRLQCSTHIATIHSRWSKESMQLRHNQQRTAAAPDICHLQHACRYIVTCLRTVTLTLSTTANPLFCTGST